MEEKINIFISADKPFVPLVKNSCYKIITRAQEMENDSELEVIRCGNDGDKLNENFYGVFYMLNYLSENVKLPKYVGVCNNDRYFGFLDDIPDMDEMFEDADCVITKPINLRTNIIEQYGVCHNIEDLIIVKDILEKRYKTYQEPTQKFLNGNIFIPNDMFIMKKNDFKKWCKFVSGVLDKYLKIVGDDIDKRIEDNSDKYIKYFHPNNTKEYQYKIGAYLTERLTNIFIMKNFKQMKIYNTIIDSKTE